MKAIEEIGAVKILRFLFFSFISSIYHLLIDHIFNLPPIRQYFLIFLGAKIGKDSILMSVKFFNWHYGGPGVLKIGNECFIGDETLIDLYDQVHLENQVTIAQKVTILTHQNVGYRDHPLQKHFPKFSKPVIFKRGSVVGAGSIILPGVIVGKESFVAAGSVVTRDVPARTLVGGVPAKIIRKIK
ncbi:MAG: Transferase hexapeptide repeat containing protein [Candidatus Woesebacteria bacterium GW2011_GWB1_39_10]|uniref:Transferase hexapeptide repeat containing protein n=1 Tax=Candidatus Woesebacteria bacterium GW2011_GWB1_39_10 TaxID=1618572 RepID=A0A0G0NZJ1_9BACT|nr:MAG: Transferase hexapeptide repeat containing protein [Candidatus Woesebacteria bacterium GW2011_GWB1_39_10]